MATVKSVSIQEQNSNALAGIQTDTAVYVGTGAAGIPSLRVGREAPVYVIEGIQTAVTMNIVAEITNAYSGATFNIRVGTGAGSTSVMQVVNATTGGTVISTSSGRKDIFITYSDSLKAWK